MVWDSDAACEYEECLLKARVLTTQRPSFQLLEALLWEPDGGYFLLAEHLARLVDTAIYFNVPLDRIAIEACLADRALTLNAASKIRLRVNPDGVFALEAEPLVQGTFPQLIRVGLARSILVQSGCITRRPDVRSTRASAPRVRIATRSFCGMNAGN